MSGSLDSRLTALELQMKGTVDRKMSNIESSLDRKMSQLENKASDLGRDSVAAAASWRWPFIILVTIMIAGAIGLYMFYLKMKKMHLL